MGPNREAVKLASVLHGHELWWVPEDHYGPMACRACGWMRGVADFKRGKNAAIPKCQGPGGKLDRSELMALAKEKGQKGGHDWKKTGVCITCARCGVFCTDSKRANELRGTCPPISREMKKVTTDFAAQSWETWQRRRAVGEGARREEPDEDTHRMLESGRKGRQSARSS